MEVRVRGRICLLPLLIVALLLPTILACGATVSPTATATAAASPVRTVTPTALAPTATPTPTSTSTPTPVPPSATSGPPTVTSLPSSPSPTPTSQAVIEYFRANVGVADPGDTITLEWSWRGGASGTIYHVLSSGQLGTPWWEVDPTGSLDYTISPQARNTDRFILFVNDSEGLMAQEGVEIELRCPDEWFFEPAPDICPAGPAIVSDGAEQHFQRGVMLWSRAEDRIYVLFDDGGSRHWQTYEDEFDEGEDPESDPSLEPPPGSLQPVRGFGLVWREHPSVREGLGWALESERGYETAIQRTSRFRYNDTYVRAFDGGLWRLGPWGSEWEYVP